MNLKQQAGERAVTFVEDGMVVGLGTGSTAYYAIRKLGELARQGMEIKGVCTSEQTRDLAREYGITVVDIEDAKYIDLTIDGADEVDPDGQGIKGGGGALLYEKIVASNSRQNIWVVEKRKLVPQLGDFPLPVEIMPFGHRNLLRKMEERNWNPVLRKKGSKIFTTDGHHYIVDLRLDSIPDPQQLDSEIRHLPGVVEHGLFLDTVNKVVAAGPDKVEIISFR
ncbi:MAG: ribose-5-phosphate isomerase RpiA [Bacteroidales bacterium]